MRAVLEHRVGSGSSGRGLPLPCHDGAQVLNHVVGRCDLQLARYLHQGVGFPFDNQVLLWAARGACEVLVEWLVGAGCVKHGPAYLKAAYYGDKGGLEALRRAGVPWGAGVVAEATGCGCPLPVVRWLLAEGAPVGSEEEVEVALKTVQGSSGAGVVGAWELREVLGAAGGREGKGGVKEGRGRRGGGGRACVRAVHAGDGHTPGGQRGADCEPGGGLVWRLWNGSVASSGRSGPQRTWGSV